MTMLSGARILVAPLDWGLGHATRCVPIVRRLIALGAQPVIGADAGPLALLRSEFPELEHVRIPGVNVRYSKGRSQLWSMARQFPAMVRSVPAERALFDRLKNDLRLDAVISDQRFGIRSADLPSVLITHQVFPFTPIAQGALRKVNLHHIARFDRCWIMDEPDASGLAGELSHGRDVPRNARYIGTVSRMQADDKRPARSFHIVAVISGPEPQRTLLDDLLTERLQRIPGEHLLVRGLPAQHAAERIGNLTKLPHLNGAELTQALLASELIVSRSGYTTLMDLVALGRTALIIPTPGQAEQEYLGALHARTGRFLVQRQEDIDLAQGLSWNASAVVPTSPTGNKHLERALEDLATLLR
ncbi:MAG: glycosyltransferase [Flavobacteriales bacterium]